MCAMRSAASPSTRSPGELLAAHILRSMAQTGFRGVRVENIKSSLGLGKDEEDRQLAEFVSSHGKKLLATLLFCRLSEEEIRQAMRHFMDTGHNNESLPFSKDRIDERASPFDLESIWDDSLLAHNFYSWQWSFIVPQFGTSESKRRFLHELDSCGTLPITYQGTAIKGGNFSNVYNAKIHRSHLLRDDMNKTDDLATEVALKEISFSEVMASVARQQQDQREVPEEKMIDAHAIWEQEVKVLEDISKLTCPNITKYIDAFKRGDTCYIMFEWANGGNLREFWDTSPENWGPALVEDSLVQLLGLASAIAKLHFFKLGESVSGQEGQQGSVRHGDLKPENILRFLGTEKEKLGTLKIVDMGVAKRHFLATEDRRNGTSTSFATIRYEPPEARRSVNPDGQARSRQYDIWSLGCIMLEFIIWILYGREGLKAFNDDLKDKQGQDSEFFERQGTGATGTADVRKAVKTWMDHILNEHPEGKRDSATRDLVSGIKASFLVVDLARHSPATISGDPNSHHDERMPFVKEPTPEPKVGPVRADAIEARKLLEDIVRRGREDSSYAFSGLDRGLVTLPAPTLAHPDFSCQPIPRSLPEEDPLDEVWKFEVDNAFASKIVSKIGTSIWDTMPPTSNILCSRCSSLDVSMPFSVDDSMSNLMQSAEHCDLCALFLRASQNMSKGASHGAGFESRGTSIVEKSGSLQPPLSIFREPGSNRPRHLQIGLLQLLQPGKPQSFDLFRTWLKDCGETHAQHNCRPFEQGSLPTRLIEVRSRDSASVRLVTTSSVMSSQGAKFVALSHPWEDPKAKQWVTIAPFFAWGKRKEGRSHPPYHHHFKHDHPGDNRFAVKWLYSESKEAFQKEVEGLKKFSDDAHSHLISLLATYEHAEKYCLIFRRRKQISSATGNRTQNPSLTSSWLDGTKKTDGQHQHQHQPATPSSAIRPLAKTVLSLSSGAAGAPSIFHPGELFGRHGDIKPENILLFPDKDDTRGILKTPDFGLAEFSSRKTRSVRRQVPGLSPSYRAPEADLRGKVIRRSYDIWTLGCLYLEFATWAIGGLGMVSKFKRLRADGHPNDPGIKEDTFFYIHVDEEEDGREHMSYSPPGLRKREARLKENVKTFVTDELFKHPNCSGYFVDLLKLIRNEMLIIEDNRTCRVSCPRVHAELLKMEKECKRNPRYVLKQPGKPRVVASGAPNAWRSGTYHPPRSTDAVNDNDDDGATSKLSVDIPDEERPIPVQRFIPNILSTGVARRNPYAQITAKIICRHEELCPGTIERTRRETRRDGALTNPNGPPATTHASRTASGISTTPSIPMVWPTWWGTGPKLTT
ncbi:hypothetical protein MKZ38_001898 [Zalerion maritima]|uniref:Protein kinase domain-containing protein n=1 Tax=Zalerion maritima TaxID=339359 RepID=A0AAD5WTJ1_9PEZI|nr:hypothetical protein MKZ38_001898 [Zalerion maritima]